NRRGERRCATLYHRPQRRGDQQRTVLFRIPALRQVIRTRKFRGPGDRSGREPPAGLPRRSDSASRGAAASVSSAALDAALRLAVPDFRTACPCLASPPERLRVPPEWAVVAEQRRRGRPLLLPRLSARASPAAASRSRKVPARPDRTIRPE